MKKLLLMVFVYLHVHFCSDRVKIYGNKLQFTSQCAGNHIDEKLDEKRLRIHAQEPLTPLPTWAGNP